MFKRDKFSKWERGIAVGAAPDNIWSIVTKNYKMLDSEPYKHELLPYLGAFTTQL
jgi:hypothetical protein